MRGGAALFLRMIARVLVVAMPDNPAVLICGVPSLASEVSSAVAADDPVGKRGLSAVAVSEFLPGFDLQLYQLEYLFRHDGGMGVLLQGKYYAPPSKGLRIRNF